MNPSAADDKDPELGANGGQLYGELTCKMKMRIDHKVSRLGGRPSRLNRDL